MIMEIIFLLSGLTGYGLIPLQDEADAGEAFAVVELFTSQGCSSCPPADAYLSDLTEQAAKGQLPIYTLSFHVDYWDYLGWKDPFAEEAYTRRQRDYAGHMRESRVYTPQMIVNGTRVFVGSDRKEGRRLIQRALKRTRSQKKSMTLGLVKGAADLNVNFDVGPGFKGDLLQLAVVESQLERHVRRGENRNRKLRHDHVVRAFQTIKLDGKGKGQAEISLPADFEAAHGKLIAYVQKRGPGRILMAKMIGL